MKFKLNRRERPGHKNKKKLMDDIETAAEKKVRAKRKIKNKMAKASRKKNR